MEPDIEAAGAASASGLSAGTHHPVVSGLPCGNCGEVVPDRYCSTCGQLAADFHRPVWELVSESLGDMFALDGRLVRSLPLLLFRPGRMTRNYLDGQRARYVPPFRMFLMASVLFFLTIFTLSDELGWFADWTFTPQVEGGMEVDLPGPDDPAAPADSDLGDGIQFSELLQADGTISRDALHEIVRARAAPDASPAELAVAFRTADQAATVYENQDRFGARLRQWAPRFSLLFLPVFSLLLTLLYAWRRRVYVFDHLIAGLHFQTFLYLLCAGLLLAGAVFPQAAGWLAVAGIVTIFSYIYRLLRVVYGTGRMAAGLRAAILLIFGMILLAVMAAGLVILSFLLT